jgi:glycosyltransferase involved in cell wall biosynthesis
VTTEPLRILQVSPRSRGGGAERVAVALHEGLRGRGHLAWLALGTRDTSDPYSVEIPSGALPPAQALRWAARRARRLDGQIPGAKQVELALRAAASPGRAVSWLRGREYFAYPGTRSLMTLPPQVPDLIHCHNLHGDYFDLRELGQLSHALPVVLTLHDEWTFTGHCAYTMGIELWRTGCHSCPDRGVFPSIGRNASHLNWEAKQRIYSASRLYVTSPSEWLMNRARESILAGGAAGWRTIPTGVDRSVFHPGAKEDARAKLGLPQSPLILLFAAHRARRSAFKDYATVLRAAQIVADRLPGQELLVLALGEAGPTERFGSAEVRFISFEVDVDRVATYYRAADLYMHAARADNLPTVILEALASGLPVVATAVGGIPEEVLSLEAAPGAWTGPSAPLERATGVLVAPGDAIGMAEAVTTLLLRPELRARLGANGIADVTARFDVDRQLDATVNWYRDVLADWHAWRARG